MGTKEVQQFAPPSQLLTEYTPLHDQIVLEGVMAEVEKVLAKAELAATSRTSINETNKALLKIREGKELLHEPVKLDQIETRVRRFSHETQLNAYVEVALKVEFKRKRKTLWTNIKRRYTSFAMIR